MEFEGSEAGIVKFLRKMKVLGGVAGRGRESVSPGRRNRPAGLKYSGKRKVWSAGALPRTLATYASLPARLSGASWPGPGTLK